jgi:uncharacterized membrane protein
MFLVGSLLSGIVAYILGAGVVQAAIKQLRGQTPVVGDIFSGLSKAVPLGIAGVVVSLGVNIGAMFCVVPGVLFGALSLLTMPLITDQNMQPMDALKKSIETLKGDMWSVLGYYLVFSIIASLGGALCGVGALFTMPLLPLGIALLYRDFFPDASPESGR